MPATKLSNQATTVLRFDVLAIAPLEADQPLHVMLCSEKNDREDVTVESELRVAHMGPPLGEKRAVKSHAVGNAGLTDDQRRQIETFVNERFEEVKQLRALARIAKEQWNSAKQYRIHPPVTKPSRDCNFWRFSCVGFVLAAYQVAGITLIGDVKPRKRLDQLKRIYADARLDDPAFRADMGIGAGDDWPVVLAGYVMNALNRPTVQICGPGSIPYEPSEDDEYFPPRPSENLATGR
jgi:hypothetical protein